MLRKLVCMLGLTMFIAGCASVGTIVKDDQLKELKRGETTLDNVVSMFGKPVSSVLNSDGTRTISYFYTDNQVRQRTCMPFIRSFMGGADTGNNSVTMRFDGNGKLLDYTASCGEFTTGRGFSSDISVSRVEDRPGQNTPVASPLPDSLPEAKSTAEISWKELKPSKTKPLKIDDSLKETTSGFRDKLIRYKGKLQSLYRGNGSTLTVVWSSEKCYCLKSEILEFVYVLFKTYPGWEKIESINFERTCNLAVKKATLHVSQLKLFHTLKINAAQLLQGIE